MIHQLTLSMTEEEIINAICSAPAEQKKALEILYSQKGNEFKRFYRYKGLSTEDSSELLQEVIVKIFVNAKQFTGQKAQSENSANAWMWMIARNCLHDYFLKSNKTKSTSQGSLDDENWIADNLDRYTKGENALLSEKKERDNEIEIENCVSKSLEEFNSTNPDRAKVIMMQIDGFSIESISKEINRTANATKVYISECKKKLMPYLNHCYEKLLQV